MRSVEPAWARRGTGSLADAQGAARASRELVESEREGAAGEKAEATARDAATVAATKERRTMTPDNLFGAGVPNLLFMCCHVRTKRPDDRKDVLSRYLIFLS